LNIVNSTDKQFGLRT